MQLRSNSSMPACCFHQYQRLFSIHKPCFTSMHGLGSPVYLTSAAAAATGTAHGSAAAVHRRRSHHPTATGYQDAPVTAYGQVSAAGSNRSATTDRVVLSVHAHTCWLKACSHPVNLICADHALQVISAEANFVRVNISHLETDRVSSNGAATSSCPAADPALPSPPVKQLLCTVRALLKKIGQRVLVGDLVRVRTVDWSDGRGVVDSIQPRSSELADPAVANVDHVLLLFGLTQPPVSWLVAADHSGRVAGGCQQACACCLLSCDVACGQPTCCRHARQLPLLAPISTLCLF